MTDHARVLIRCDIGAEHGMGRAVRCRALARAVLAQEHGVVFITQTLADLEHFMAPLAGLASVEHPLGFWTPETVSLQEISRGDVWCQDCDATVTEPPPWWWRDRLRKDGIHCVLIDSQPQDDQWDVLIFPNAHQSLATLVQLEIDFPSRVLHGWDYVMLDSGVTQQAPVPYAERRDGPIVFCAGGSDPDGALRQMYHWAASLDVDVPKVFLIGQYAMNLPVASDGHGARGGMWVEPFEQRWLRSAALVVTAFGQTVYECLWYGTPALVWPRTEADGEMVERLVQVTHVAIDSYTKPWWQIESEYFCAKLRAIYQEIGGLRPAMHAASAGLIDGRGVDRVAGAILDLEGESHA